MLMLGSILGCSVFFSLQHDPNIQVITNTSEITIYAILYKMVGLFTLLPYRFEQIVHIGNGPLVTCIIECWLYILYPVAMRLIQTIGSKLFWILLSLILVIGTILCNNVLLISSWWHNGAIFSFIFYWWIGVYAVSADTKIYNYKIPILSGLIFSTLFVFKYPELHVIIELKKIFLALATASFLRWGETIITFKFPRDLAATSFCIYALHMPLLCLALHNHIKMLPALSYIISIALLSHYVLEKPIIWFFSKKMVQFEPVLS